MCFPSADTVNYRGDTLSESDKAMLENRDPGSIVPRNSSWQAGSPQFRAQMLQNWLTGGGFPKVPDPTVQLAQSKALQPIYQQAALGQGFTGLFKLPKPNASPMGEGVPYSAPPIGPILGGKP